MLKIKVLHLYYDLMNLYGENANIRAIETYLNRFDVKVTTDLLTINDDIDFSKYDIIYMGSGTEKSEMLVLEDLMKYKKILEKL